MRPVLWYCHLRLCRLISLCSCSVRCSRLQRTLLPLCLPMGIYWKSWDVVQMQASSFSSAVREYHRPGNPWTKETCLKWDGFVHCRAWGQCQLDHWWHPLLGAMCWENFTVWQRFLWSTSQQNQSLENPLFHEPRDRIIHQKDRFLSLNYWETSSLSAINITI